MLDNVPIKPLVDNCDKLIAVDIMPLKKENNIKDLNEIITRIFELSISIQKEDIEKCDLYIKLKDLPDSNILDTSKNKEIYKIGYNHVKNMDELEFKKIFS